jgi:antitoxin MazE
MTANIIDMGEFVGIKLDKSLLQRYNLIDKVELEFNEDSILIKPNVPRQNWDIKFKQMHSEGDDLLLIDSVFEDEEILEY